MFVVCWADRSLKEQVHIHTVLYVWFWSGYCLIEAAAAAVSALLSLLILPCLLLRRCCCCCRCCGWRRRQERLRLRLRLCLWSACVLMLHAVCHGASRTRTLWASRRVRLCACTCDARDIVGASIELQRWATYMRIEIHERKIDSREYFLQTLVEVGVAGDSGA